MAGLHLLVHQRFGGCHEHHFTVWKPAVVVVHHHRRNEGLAQPGGQTHQCVAQESVFANDPLVFSNFVVGGVDPSLHGVRVDGDGRRLRQHGWNLGPHVFVAPCLSGGRSGNGGVFPGREGRGEEGEEEGEEEEEEKAAKLSTCVGYK